MRRLSGFCEIWYVFLSNNCCHRSYCSIQTMRIGRSCYWTWPFTLMHKCCNIHIRRTTGSEQLFAKTDICFEHLGSHSLNIIKSCYTEWSKCQAKRSALGGSKRLISCPQLGCSDGVLGKLSPTFLHFVKDVIINSWSDVAPYGTSKTVVSSCTFKVVIRPRQYM